MARQLNKSKYPPTLQFKNRIFYFYSTTNKTSTVNTAIFVSHHNSLRLVIETEKVLVCALDQSNLVKSILYRVYLKYTN